MDPVRELIRYGRSSRPSRGHTVRDHIPRGQTRRLASTFEAIAKAASVEKLLGQVQRSPRPKSVPARPRNPRLSSPRPNRRQRRFSKASLDESFVEEWHPDTETCGHCRPLLETTASDHSDGVVQEAVTAHNWETLPSVDCVELSTVSNVRSLASRYESQLSNEQHEMSNGASAKTYHAARGKSLERSGAERFSDRPVPRMRINPPVNANRISIGLDHALDVSTAPPSEDGTAQDARVPQSGNKQTKVYGQYGNEPIPRTVCGDFGRTNAPEMAFSETTCSPIHCRADAKNVWNQRRRHPAGDIQELCTDCSLNSDVKFRLGGGSLNNNITEVCKTPVTRVGLTRDSGGTWGGANDEPPVRFSPATFNSVPSAGERVVVYERKDTGNVLQSKRDSVTRPPVLTSTPVEGSPATESHQVHDSPSRLINRSGISTIASSTLNDNNTDYDYLAQIKRLNEGMLIQGERLSQAMVALSHAKNFCNNKGAGILAELCAYRELLLCRERHVALNRELERIKMLHLIQKKIPQLSSRMLTTLEVTSITVRLNRNFCNRTSEDSYAFLALLKSGDQIVATEALTPIGSTARVISVQFNDYIRFNNLPIDFTLTLHIYALKMQVPEPLDDNHCAALRSSARMLNSHICVVKQSVRDESAVSCCEFTLSGSVLLNRDTVGTQRFYMDDVEYPLDGQIEVKSYCSAIPPIIQIEFSGFLTMYEMVSGMGSWTRLWAVLRRGAVQLWKYPDDEACDKAAIAHVDLTKCMNATIKRTALDMCLHPNTFSVDLLVSVKPSLIEKKRVLLSADTAEQCTAWIEAINETLFILRE